FQSDFFDSKSKIYSELVPQKKSTVEVEIILEDCSYPFSPPKVRIISPRLKYPLAVTVSTMKILNRNEWRPNYNIELIITNFKKIMDDHAEIDPILNYWTDLENDLIDLSILTEINISNKKL